MPRTLSRYVIREQLTPLGVCFLGICLILITGRLLQLTRFLFASSVDVWDVIEIIGYAMPKLIIYAFPMSTLIGVLLAFVRLNGDNELVGCRAAGVSFAQFLPSVLMVSCLVTVLSFFNSVIILPHANSSFQNKFKSIGRVSIPAMLKEGTFIDLIPKLVFYFNSVNTADLAVQGILVQDQRQPNLRIVIIAERAQLAYQKDYSHIVFKIHNGIITRVPDNLKDAQSITFRTYELSLSLDEIFGTVTGGSKGRKEMSLSELYSISYGNDTKTDPRFPLEFHSRLALPFSCLLLGLVGAPLGALFRQKGRLTGITLGILLFLTYYIGLSAGRGLGENRLVSPFIAMWSPNMSVAALAIYLWTKAHRETPFKIATLVSAMSQRIDLPAKLRMIQKT